MLRQIKTNAFLVAALAICLVSASSYALDDNVMPEGDLTIRKIVNALRDADLKVKVDDDGDIQISARGEEIWVRPEVDKSRVYIMSYRRFRNSAGQPEKLQLANKINLELVMIRASVTKDGERLWLDYSLLTEEGVTITQIVNSANRFFKLLDLINKKDTDDILR